MKALWDLRWRTGRKVTRHVYAQAGDEPSDTDDVEVFVAVGESVVATGVAAHIVSIHNAWLEGR